MIGNGKRHYASKLIQTREMDDNKRSIGSIFSLVVDDKYNSEPYYYVGSTNNIGFFIHADIVNERALMEWKRKLEHDDVHRSNILQFIRHHDGKL